MVVKLSPSNFLGVGITRIDRKPGESQEHFDATKDEATYQVKDHVYTLILDGKVDSEVMDGVRPMYGEKLISDVGELAPHYSEIAKACKESEDFLATATVDLGTGHDWAVLPKYKSDDHSIYGYDLISGPGPQTIAVYPMNVGMDMTLSTKNVSKDLGHSVSAKFTAEGLVTPFSEGISWKP